MSIFNWLALNPSSGDRHHFSLFPIGGA